MSTRNGCGDGTGICSAPWEVRPQECSRTGDDLLRHWLPSRPRTRRWRIRTTALATVRVSRALPSCLSLELSKRRQYGNHLDSANSLYFLSMTREIFVGQIVSERRRIKVSIRAAIITLARVVRHKGGDVRQTTVVMVTPSTHKEFPRVFTMSTIAAALTTAACRYVACSGR